MRKISVDFGETLADKFSLYTETWPAFHNGWLVITNARLDRFGDEPLLSYAWPTHTIDQVKIEDA